MAELNKPTIHANEPKAALAERTPVYTNGSAPRPPSLKRRITFEDVPSLVSTIAVDGIIPQGIADGYLDAVKSAIKLEHGDDLECVAGDGVGEVTIPAPLQVRLSLDGWSVG